MSRRDQIRMTEDEISAFLDGQKTIILSTNGPDGRPHVVPMWFVVLDGYVHTWTFTRSQKIKNLERDPRATLLVEDGESYEQLRGVMMQADADLIRDEGEIQEMGWALAVRYAGGQVPTDPDARAGLDAFVKDQATKRTAVRYRPVEITSWDHHKLGGTY